ncbi:DUF637 domain-containing protein [Paraburkholderia sp. SARCC-3016]|uniref:DUF637 domain-containing protein n=1 Tax=Paraburkholderia sp. SARCC-3016 TaxID=3058611 RepID=UPI002809AE7D|nr:DUF637 domain-containing protein [Paraburkholderia sp. SARCC-3016]MDQ7976708.1 DUF637 domain-containing protein [Paraburkholderia sp. SARCC-3016]
MQETGMFSSDKRHDTWACGSPEECTQLYGSAYTNTGGAIDPPTPVGNIAATIQAPNLSITSNGQIQNVGNVIGTSVSLTGQQLINGITTANTYTPRVNAPSQVISLSPVNLPGLNLSTPRRVGDPLPTAVAGQAAFVEGSLAPSAIGDLGPQDLLNNLPLNLQPGSTLFYYNPQEEDVLRQQAALQQTGKASFIDGLSYDSTSGATVTEQEKAYLYQNAIDYAKANNLQLGDALTQAQVSELDKPMLWYVEQTVPDPDCKATGNATCPTITALMPQVYLPSDTSAMSAGGNISGADVTLNFNQDGNGSILNTGSITASDTLTVNTQTLTNQANQVDVGQIWSKVSGGYVDTTGTTVQPGGFMSAANMDLNVETLNQIGGALQALNADGSVNTDRTQALLEQIQAQLGTNFTQTSESDNLHTDFVKEGGGFGIGQLIGMIAAVVLSVYMGPEMFALYNRLIDPIALAAIGPTLAVLGSAAATGLAAATTALAAGAVSQVISTGSLDLKQDIEGAGVAGLTAGLAQGLLGSTGITNWGNGVTQASSNTTLADIGNTVENIGGQALIGASVQTVIEGGSFGSALLNSAAQNAAAVGANGIGKAGSEYSWMSSDSPLYVIAHAGLGCAAGAAEGTGCAGGAIGGAVSAGVNPIINGSGNLSPAALAGIEMLVSGSVAGALGFNVQGAATAAQNETLNNFCEHNSCGAALTAFLNNVSSALNAGADVPVMDAAAGTDVLAGIGNTALNISSGSLPGSDSFVPYFQYNNPALGALGETYATLGLGALALSAFEGALAANTAGTSEGTANAATLQGLKGQLANENLANIAAQDPRLAAAVNGSGTSNINFPIGTGTAAEADTLGQTWVGDGARPINGVPGGLVSADGTRVYRPPTAKPNTPVQYAPTGVLANFQQLENGVVISNGHLNISKP